MFDDRKAILKRQISNALRAENSEHLIILKGQWIHRYGMDTLPDDYVVDRELVEVDSLEEKTSEPINDIAADYFPKKEKEKRESIPEQKEVLNELIELDLDERQNATQFDENKVDKNFNLTKNEFINSGKPEDKTENDNLKESNKEKNELEEEQFGSNLDSDFSGITSPPPPPSINQLRRWLSK